MHWKSGGVFLLLLLILSAGFSLWSRLLDFPIQFSDHVSKLEENAVAAIEEVRTEISTPEPLRARDESADTFLTQAGTIRETNKHRANYGLSPFRLSVTLAAAAAVKATDMLARQYFAHESPFGDGPAELAQDQGYAFLAIGENLALGNFENDGELVQAWMNSPGHRENILSQRYTEIGVAVLQGLFEGRKTWIAVQEFGRPVSDCPAIDPTLRAHIESNETSLKNFKIEIESRRAELEALRQKRSPEYNQKVAEYNAIVQYYNDLVSETRVLINQYNLQAREFNACIGD